jgi:hypothetical protein
MKKSEVGGIIGRSIRFSGLDKVPWGFIQERITSDMRRPKPHTEEATIMFMMIPCGFISLITMRTVEKWLGMGLLGGKGRKSLS